MNSTLLQNPPLPAYRLRIRVGIILGLLYFYSRWWGNTGYYSWLDNVNLIFHEAGHPLMGLFGDMPGVMGGTIFQLLIPTIIGVHLFLHRSNLGRQLCLFWIGENFLNIARYAGDAIKQEYPLLGGPNSIHDWRYMFIQWGVLDQCTKIAHIFFIIGSCLIIASLLYMLYEGIRREPMNIGYPE